jgi:hypothetical protein
MSIVLYLLGAVSLTWPLAANMHTHLPMGTESSATVPLFNLWALEWHSLQAQAGYPSFWDAPIFHPQAGTIALSEPHWGIGGAYTLFRALLGSPAAAYNLLLLAIITLNGAAGYYLGWRVSERPIPALVCGWLAQTLPFVHHELGVLQLTIIFPPLLALAAFYALVMTLKPRYALSMGLWCGMTALTSGYYAAFLAVLLPLGTIAAPKRSKGLLIAAGVMALVFTLPALRAQQAQTTEFSRSRATVQRNSAALADYTERHPATFGAGSIERGSIQHLYPGTAILIVGMLGLAAAPPQWRTVCLVMGVAAFLLSLGLNLTILRWQPYTLLMAHVPGFDLLRSPFRAAVFVPLSLLACVSLGVKWALERLSKKQGMAFVLALSLLAMDGVILPARLAPYPAAPEGWVVWLRDHPGDVVIAHVPFPSSGRAAAYQPTVEYMLYGLQHGAPMVNGYSGFFPSGYRLIAESMAAFPDALSTSRLQRTGVTHVVIEARWLTEGREQALDWLGYQLVYRDDSQYIYRLP